MLPKGRCYFKALLPYMDRGSAPLIEISFKDPELVQAILDELDTNV